MENGIYHVVLKSSGKSADTMAVVFADAINGGGSGYVLQGCVFLCDAVISGRLFLKKWAPEAPPVLGLFKELSMKIDGYYDKEKRLFNFKGRFYGHHAIEVRADGRWVAPLL